MLVEPLPEKNSDSRMIAPKSAIEAAAITSWPKLEPMLPESLSTGTITPSEVATSTIATNSGDLTKPPACRPKPSDDRDRERDREAERGELQDPSPQALDVDLEAGEEQQEGQPHERQDRHRAGRA